MSDSVAWAVERLNFALERTENEEAGDAIRDVLDQLTGWIGNPKMRLVAPGPVTIDPILDDDPDLDDGGGLVGFPEEGQAD